MLCSDSLFPDRIKYNAERIKDTMFWKDQTRRQRIDLLIRKEETKLVRKLTESQHLIEVEGGKFTVDFPYKPYSVQTEFVQIMTNAIMTGQNAMLECPTGTGKTLMMLTAALESLNQLRKETPLRHQ